MNDIPPITGNFERGNYVIMALDCSPLYRFVYVAVA
jgi:hypothetical protein